MPERRFPILGTSVPPMVGRDSVLQRVVGALTKATPDHLQVVGPRFAGKTVLLHELARRLRNQVPHYTCVLVWDLGHQTPATDGLFMQGLAAQLSSALRSYSPEYAEYLNSSGENSYQDVAEVLDLLKTDGRKVLAILDGFDKPLSNGRLTRNLWDQLRELALKPSLRLVTASRRTLRELIRQPDAQTSDFWNIFDPTPVRVGCFDDDDFSALLMNLHGGELAAGARTEIWNASNGFPVVMLEIFNALSDRGEAGEIDAETMRSACDAAYPALVDKLDTLWSECGTTSQDLFRRVAESGSLQRTSVSSVDAGILIERGFVHLAANKLQRPSRLLQRYLEEHPHEGNALVRLFGTSASYEKHFKVVLEHRIAQISGMDSTLRRYLERAIGELPDHPSVFMSNVRGIVNQAFELIWNAELSAKSIPSSWVSIWKRNGEYKPDEWETSFPQGNSRLRLLKLMTCPERSQPCARLVKRDTYYQMYAAHTFGDFGQHQEGAVIEPGTAYCALHLCIELAATLTRDLAAAE